MASAGWLIFESPFWLAALPLAAGPVALAWWGRRRRRHLPVWAVVLQCLAVGLALAALAGPRAALGRRSISYLFFADASGSVRGQHEVIAGLAKSFPAGAEVERFDFADGLARPRGARPATAPAVPATRIAPVLRMIAFRCAGGSGGAVVATDGRFTDGGWEPSAAAVAGAGAEVILVPLDRPVADARIVALTVRRTSSGAVDITVGLTANASMERTLTVRRAGRAQPLLVRALTLLADSPATVAATDALDPGDSARYTAELSPGDLMCENDSAAGMVLPLLQKFAAVGLEAPGRKILSGLIGPVVYLPAKELPDRSDALADFAAIVLADATGGAFTPAQRGALGRYVGTSGGVVMLGTGPHESPADQDDPLNRVLPLLANPFQRRPLHLKVLLDRSGSMSLPGPSRPDGPQQVKFDLAAEAVLALKDHLTPRDALTVITFADAAQVAYDSGEGAPDFAALGRALRRVRATGNTHVLPALETALAGKVGGGRTPMLLVVSDLKTEEFNPLAWAENIRRAGAELAIVAIGEGSAGGQQPSTDAQVPQPPLETLAKLLSAPYVRQEDLAGLAKVFARLVRQGRGSAIHVGRTPLVTTGPLFDSALTALPETDAYVLSAARTGAEVLARSEGGEAVLARMQAGLGRSVSLALPLTATENVAWQDSPPAGALLAAAVRWVTRSPNDGRFDVALDRRPDGLHITATARQDGRPLNLLPLTAQVAWQAAGASAVQAGRPVALRQVAPGRYEGSSPCPSDQPAAVEVALGGKAVWRGSAEVLCPDEYRATGADPVALERLADLTGGRIVRPDRLAGELRSSYTRRQTALWPFLIAAALAAMLLEWCLTRVTRR